MAQNDPHHFNVTSFSAATSITTARPARGLSLNPRSIELGQRGGRMSWSISLIHFLIDVHRPLTWLRITGTIITPTGSPGEQMAARIV